TWYFPYGQPVTWDEPVDQWTKALGANFGKRLQVIRVEIHRFLEQLVKGTAPFIPYGLLGNSATYRDNAVSIEKSLARRRTSAASFPSSASSIARARASMSPGAKSLPQRPSSRISAGPLGQSVLITGVPHCMASMRTVGRPSYFEERTNSALFLIQPYGLVTNPGIKTSDPTPKLSASA